MMCERPTQKDSMQSEKGEQFCGQEPRDRLLPGFKSRLHQLLGEQPWASRFTFLSLSLLI